MVRGKWYVIHIMQGILLHVFRLKYGNCLVFWQTDSVHLSVTNKWHWKGVGVLEEELTKNLCESVLVTPETDMVEENREFHFLTGVGTSQM